MQREAWTPAAEAGLVVSAGDDMPWIKAEVQRGDAQLFKCGDDGYVVLRYEPEYREAVIVLGEGRHFRKWVPHLEAWARQQGAVTMRTHIKRQGLKRWYESIGWNQQEIVMSKTL